MTLLINVARAHSGELGQNRSASDEIGQIGAYVLTPLPGKVFQVFQVEREEEEREKRVYITNLFRPIILVSSNASPFLK